MGYIKFNVLPKLSVWNNITGSIIEKSVCLYMCLYMHMYVYAHTIYAHILYIYIYRELKPIHEIVLPLELNQITSVLT
jgi:hypothetical protein